MISKKSRIFLAGHKGMIGSAILRKLKKRKYKNIITVDKKIVDLKDQKKVFNFLKKNKPQATIIAAAKVGGIEANNVYKADFIYENLEIQNNLIHGSFLAGVKNLIFLGSSCVYPKKIIKPIKEKYLLSNYLEKTNEPYAIAKIAGIKLCESYNYQYNLNYKSLMPSNSYGINDNYNLETSHFLPALLRKITDAIAQRKDYIELWGNGKSLRELIFSDDVADASIFFLKKKTKHSLINIGSNNEFSINEYARIIMNLLGVNLRIKYVKKSFNGTFRKKLDISLANSYKWKAKTPLEKGLLITINDYLSKKVSKKTS